MKAKTILFFLILSALIPQAYAADFGEDQDYLGQVVDDYENDDNVNVSSGVIHNVTLGCMELNYSGSYGVSWDSFFLDEDFESFSDGWTVGQGGGGTITKSDTQKYEGLYSVRIYAPTTGAYCYAYKNIDETTEDSITEFYIWVDSSVQADYEHVIGLYDVSGGGYCFEVRLDYHDSGFYIQNDIANSGTDVGLIPTEEWVSIIIVFDDSEDTVNYYINGWNMGVFNANNGAMDGDRVYIGDTWGGGWKGFYYLDEFSIGLGGLVGGYETSGYYITIDVLNGDPGLAYMYNATIPAGTSIIVKFSTDNVTWVDHNNQAGSDTLLAGYESLDLRDIYNGTIYRHVNMTSDGIDTPRLWQDRFVTVTTITTGDGLFPGLAIGISLLIIGAIYAIEKRR